MIFLRENSLFAHTCRRFITPRLNNNTTRVYTRRTPGTRRRRCCCCCSRGGRSPSSRHGAPCGAEGAEALPSRCENGLTSRVGRTRRVRPSRAGASFRFFFFFLLDLKFHRAAVVIHPCGPHKNRRAAHESNLIKVPTSRTSRSI